MVFVRELLRMHLNAGIEGNTQSEVSKVLEKVREEVKI